MDKVFEIIDRHSLTDSNPTSLPYGCIEPLLRPLNEVVLHFHVSKVSSKCQLSASIDAVRRRYCCLNFKNQRRIFLTTLTIFPRKKATSDNMKSTARDNAICDHKKLYGSIQFLKATALSENDSGRTLTFLAQLRMIRLIFRSGFKDYLNHLLIFTLCFTWLGRFVECCVKLKKIWAEIFDTRWHLTKLIEQSLWTWALHWNEDQETLILTAIRSTTICRLLPTKYYSLLRRMNLDGG